MAAIDTPLQKKARGAYYTPSDISNYLAAWAIRSPNDLILEPSCGEASFLLAAGLQLRALGANQLFWSHQLHGIEIDKSSVVKAESKLAASQFDAQICVTDFFSREPTTQYDAVIGNPPYVRYQNFTGLARTRALEAALAQGVRLTGLASSWAAFVVHASRFLRPTGRLGLVLPAELLTVNYAAEVRRFLLERFARVRLVMFEDRVFPGVLEEVVLLLAEGSGGAKCFELYQARDLADLANIDAAKWTEHRPEADEKWTPALLPKTSLLIYKALVSGEGFSPLLDWGETYLGSVTGNNNYFTLTWADITHLGLRETDLVRISPPGSRHLRGLKFSHEAWTELVREGGRGFLFHPPEKLTERSAKYILKGERDKVNAAYKCANRSPWWKVPLVGVPDLFLTYMNHDRPRLISNDAGVHILNSLYGVSLRHGRKVIGKELLPIACLNSVTLLGAEVVGRAYGGGLIKLEPKEADLLPIPSERLLRTIAAELRNVRPQLSVALRQNELHKAVDLVDRIILRDSLSVEQRDIDDLRAAREVLFERRCARGRGARGEN